MPLNRSQLIRLTTIDRCLQNRYRRWTLEDLIEACSEAIYDCEGRTDGVSRRTVQADIQLMRSDKLGYEAPIIVVDKKYYTYEDKNYSITNIPLSDTDVNTLQQAMDILRHFQVFSQFSPVTDIIDKLGDHIAVTTKHEIPAIHLEKNERLKGLEHVSTLYQNIISKKAIVVNYQSFKATEPRPFTISPYLLKEYRNRWFIVCYDHFRKDICNYALDRIESIETSKDLTYMENTFFDPEHYFDDVIGVTRELKSRPQIVKLKLDADQAPYVITKPLHSSQRVIRKNDDGSIVVTIKVIYNLELERVIMGFGEHIEVLAPSLLRHRIKKKLQVAALQYNMRTPKETEEERKERLRINAEYAKLMDATVKPNNITMEEIVAEIKKVRHRK